jgi:hypothetical protein
MSEQSSTFPESGTDDPLVARRKTSGCRMNNIRSGEAPNYFSISRLRRYDRLFTPRPDVLRRATNGSSVPDSENVGNSPRANL